MGLENLSYGSVVEYQASRNGSRRLVNPDPRFSHIMALNLDPGTNHTRGVVRCITERNGEVHVPGYFDRSALHIVDRNPANGTFTIGNPLVMAGEADIIAELQGKDLDYIGNEDPDIVHDNKGRMHLFFTMVFRDVNGVSIIHLGHAEGENLDSLRMTQPVIKHIGNDLAKELSVAPPNSQGVSHHLIESAYYGGYSTVRVATVDDGEAWTLGETVFNPIAHKIPWIGAHASPGPFLPKDFIDIGDGMLVGLMNGRAANQLVDDKMVFGEFSVGLFVYDYENGKILAVSKNPFIRDPEAQTITFASQFIPIEEGKGQVVTHVDDSFVTAHDITSYDIMPILRDGMFFLENNLKRITLPDMKRRAAELKTVLQEIGLGELTNHELQDRFSSFSIRLNTGLTRQSASTTEDGGFLAIPTGIRPIPAEQWQQVATGTTTVTAEFGGINYNIYSAAKQDDGTVSLTPEPLFHRTFAEKERVVDFPDLIAQIGKPFVDLYEKDQLPKRETQNPDSPIDIGFSLFGPHANKPLENGEGTDAYYPWRPLPKEWEIAGMDPDAGLINHLRNYLQTQGLKTGIINGLNDTVGVGLDGGAKQRAIEEGYDVLPAAFVGGTGTNGALDNGNGFVNTEIGSSSTEFDSPVGQKMRERMVKQNNLSPDRQHRSVIEQELGGYIAHRLAAGIDLLGEKGILDNDYAKTLADNIDKAVVKYPELISQLASGTSIIKNADSETSQLIQTLAQEALKRASQVYGVLIATLVKPVLANYDDSAKKLALLTEGSTVLKGYWTDEQSNLKSLKEESENVAMSLLNMDPKVKTLHLYPSRGMAGIAAYTMAFPYKNHNL